MNLVDPEKKKALGPGGDDRRSEKLSGNKARKNLLKKAKENT